MSAKQCPRCLEIKPVADYTLIGGRPKGRCKSCRAEQMRQARSGSVLPTPEPPPEKKQKTTATVQPPPAKKVKKPSTAPPAPPAPPAPAIPADFSNRQALESFVRDGLNKTLVQYDELIGIAKGLYDTATNADEPLLADAQRAMTSYKTTLQAKTDLQLKLVKSFALLANLDRPAEENPEFAPVYLVLAAPPPECFVKPKWKRPDDDYQPGQLRQEDTDE